MLCVQALLWTNTAKSVPFYQCQPYETTDHVTLCDRLDEEQVEIFQALADINVQVRTPPIVVLPAANEP